MGLPRRTLLLLGLLATVLLYLLSYMKVKPLEQGRLANVSSRSLQNAFPLNGKEQKLVILYSNQRSGSTFMGEIFNRNKNAFYLYEPLFPFTPHCDVLSQDRVEILEKMLRCDFSNNGEIFKKVQQVTKFGDVPSDCIKNNVCFATQSASLYNQYNNVCEAMHHHGDCSDSMHANVLSQMCRSSNIVAFKVLRLCSLTDAEELYRRLSGGKKDFFIIHLVRDPRAIISSKLRLELQEKYVLKRAGELCQKMDKNLEFVESSAGVARIVGEKRYMRIRYEDAASEPVNTAVDVYRFLGLDVPEEVIDWINASTIQPRERLTVIQEQLRKSKTGKENQMILLRYKELLKKLKNPYGTVKDPSRTIQKWRRYLPLGTVLDVQRICSDVLKRLNFRRIRNAAELTDLSKPLWL